MNTDPSDHNARTIRRAFVSAIAVGTLVSILVIALAALAYGQREMWGAILGMGLSLIVTLPTLMTATWGIQGSASRLALSILGTWFVKMLVLITVLVLIRSQEWLSMPWVGYGLLAGAVIPTVLEIVMLMRSRTKLETSAQFRP